MHSLRKSQEITDYKRSVFCKGKLEKDVSFATQNKKIEVSLMNFYVLRCLIALL